ncbi:MAG: hypothetical protein U5L75_03380 [Candidatus Campbellbacteria bacterium]|nr:hypothetical protein [Candidatus Campbellbacteria bacterium]
MKVEVLAQSNNPDLHLQTLQGFTRYDFIDSISVCALEREENAELLERIDNATESNFGSFYDAWLGLYDRECDTSFSRLGWPNPEANEGLGMCSLERVSEV